MTTPYALLAATLDHLTRFSPFSRMERDHLVWMIERLKVGYYAKNEIILAPQASPVDTFFIVKQGVILGEQDVVQAQENATWLELREGECFPLGALLSKRGVTSTYRAGADTFCYELSADDFHHLLQQSPAFYDFCTRRIANLLEQSKQVIQAQYSKSCSDQQSMSSPLSAIIRREPITCTPAMPLREVLEVMHKNGIGSMVAVDAAHRAVGILTLHDVLARVALAGADLDQPLSTVMTPDPYAMPPNALAYEAALVMAKHGFRHILVEENGQLKGLISEKDLFSLQRVGLRHIGGDIRNAENLDALKRSAQDIRQLTHNMMAQGIAAEQLTQIISTLNDLLTTRIIELELKDSPVREIVFCWMALGSEGRFEQTLNTDQDNGILFQVAAGQDAGALREAILPFAKRVNLALAECGFPLCHGQVMAANPKWCLSQAEWQDTFADWIDHGAPMDLMHATIFFDFRPLYGAEHLAGELRDWLREAVRQNTRFLHQMAANALKNRPPLGLVRDFITGDDHTLDLKINGITPFVDAARIFSLANGGRQTNTVGRLRELAEMKCLRAQDADAYIDAFLFIQLLRLRLHHQQSGQGLPLSNHADPDSLNQLDRRILKETFRQARKLQTKLELDYQV
ncbi:MAG: prohead protease [Hydrogenophilales bacterium CG03_land_8_20_14_0_80_62_28]|nr:CBS domain-containing protein [Betaproteobacteria bacterium]OIO79723.1 MAG: prohead protease [Hydrogenophilaceae bacterium CG1_02_62_390]PIV23490.1 MAG: prohead protease [Hydrogenophilales bacterium CG03_land_8_20_14_0_80_62_28]PIW38806.1 MAG: prohead protease [Hydrogenophilales bacterium CG15_BIG_FIL_POST_REV_8_21_14_020_62_31]PIW71693.1 MAG: prohead protease [Hydrogenophilales bacterium CG12_big_fil_rev_8_21_14_0_65_61_21]PIX00705.1 MAG: prohead protease [Hydrogenophilales bacterium CG_4_